MTRWSSMLLAVIVLALMGLARMPVPCLGDGQGHPCGMEHCVCTSACSCKLECQSMADMAHHGCHMANMPHSEAPGHYSLPPVLPPMVLASRFLWREGERPALGIPGSSPGTACPSLPLPEPPPRRLA